MKETQQALETPPEAQEQQVSEIPTEIQLVPETFPETRLALETPPEAQEQQVSYINHAGKLEHAELISFKDKKATLRVFGSHENDIRIIENVPFDASGTIRTFNYTVPPNKPELSAVKQHAPIGRIEPRLQ